MGVAHSNNTNIRVIGGAKAHPRYPKYFVC